MASSRLPACVLLLTGCAVLASPTHASPSSTSNAPVVQGTPLPSPPPLAPALKRMRDLAPLVGTESDTVRRPIRERFPNARPMPLPKLPAQKPPRPEGSSASERTILTFDRETGRVYRQEMAAVEEILGPRYTSAGVGLRELLEEPESVPLNFNMWEPVLDPTYASYPRRVKLFMTFRDWSGQPIDAVCSGTLIDPKHVITAAHCIWSHEIDGAQIKAFAEEVEVVPAYHDGLEPFGSAIWAQGHVWTPWVEDRDFDHDIGIVDLQWNIGALTGWWNYGYNEDCDFWETPMWHHEGWPEEPPYDGETMYRNSGDFQDCDEEGWDNQATWEGPSWGGSSGSGSVKTGSGAVFAVLSTSDRETVTSCCKMTATKFDHVGQIIQEDRPLALDLSTLGTQASEDVEAGYRPDFFDFLVLNYSQATESGTWQYLMFLSADRIITMGDTYLGAGSFDYTFAPSGVVRVNALPPLIPAETPSGFYWLGVILNVADGDIGNNITPVDQTARIHVQCPNAGTPTLAGPLNGGVCIPTDVMFDWNATVPMADYQFQVGTACTTGEILTLPVTEYTYYDLDYDTEYFWRVRSRSECGTWGPWSECWSFTTIPDPSQVVTAVDPQDGQHCLPTDVTITWSAIAGALGYEFRIGTTCGTGTVQSTAGNSIQVSLEAGMEYFWKVRARTHCGAWAAWSPCYDFKTTPIAATGVTLSYPADLSPCVPPDAHLGWRSVPDAASYDVQVGTTCGTGTIYNVAQNMIPLTGLANEVTYFWRVRSRDECGPVSRWSLCWSFDVDGEPPAPPAGLVASPPVATWSKDNTISVDWPPVPDNCVTPCYSNVFDRDPATVPDDVIDEEEPFAMSGPLPDGNDHWFHTKTIDAAGNVSAAVHLGPFWIDCTGPTAPQFDYATLDPGHTTGPTVLMLDWLPSTDALSGVAGYSWAVNVTSTPPAQLDDIVDLAGLSITAELEQAYSFWFFVRGVDRAGNGGGNLVVGPFTCDHSRFGVFVTAPTRDQVLVEGAVYRIRWGIYDDGPAILQGGQLAYAVEKDGDYVVIANLTPAQVRLRYYDWTVPMAASTEAVIRLGVTDTQDRFVYGRSPRFTLRQVTTVPPPAIPAADRWALETARPNPFTPQTTISFTLPRGAHATLSIFDIQGRLVRTLVDAWRDGPRTHEATWDGCDERGLPVPSGVYQYMLRAEDFRQARRVVLIR